MKFKEVFGKYQNLTGLSQAKIAKESGLAAYAVSRYASGNRTPAKDSEIIKTLANTFYNNAKSQNLKIDFDTVLSDFLACEEYKDDNFSARLDSILTKYEIKTSALSQALSMDNSFVSRIRNGIRSPKDISGFVQNTCKYITKVRPEVSYEEVYKEFETDSFSVNNTNHTPVKPEVQKPLAKPKANIKNSAPGATVSEISDTESIKPTKKSRPVSEKRVSSPKDQSILDKLGSILKPHRKPKKSRRSKRPR